MPVILPRSLSEALGHLADADGGITPIAGGTDLLAFWPDRVQLHDRTYVDLSHLLELRSISFSGDFVTLGALCTYWDVITHEEMAREFPMMIEAARQVGAIQIQSRGTWAGNIANASPAADGVPALMAYDAVVVMASKSGMNEVALDRFYTGYKRMALRSDQLITAIRIPRRKHLLHSFHKVGPRRAQAITKVGVAIAHSAQHGWRVAANSVAPTVCRCRQTEALLADSAPLGSPDDLLPALAHDINPIDDIRSTAEYRRIVLSRVLYSALKGFRT